MAKPKLRNLPDLSGLAVDGTEIVVRVTPKAARDRIFWEGDPLRVAVTAPPENGKANAAVRAVLAAALKFAPTQLTLRRGQSARDKTFVYEAKA